MTGPQVSMNGQKDKAIICLVANEEKQERSSKTQEAAVQTTS
jgi:hypothetical protein